MEEERAFFTNVLTVTTVIVALVVSIAALDLGINAALNGSNKPSLAQVQMTCAFNHALTKYILIFVGVLLLACLLRFLSSLKWKKLRHMFKNINCMWVLSWIVLIIAIVYGLWLIIIYTCSL
jgi:hypothetical protein